MRLAITITCLASACGSTSPVGPVRFVNAPPATRVNDRVDVPRTPRERPPSLLTYQYDSYYLLAQRGFDLTPNPRARGVNSFDEVPDSTWFTNRIGVRDMSPDEIRRGPPGESPEGHFPWLIESSKLSGDAIGFLVRDSRGVRFLLKFDESHAPEVETGAAPIVARLLWAAGYNVPSEHVVYFDRRDLRIAPDAKPGIDHAIVQARLAQIAFTGNGKIRALASIFIEGKTLGGTPRLGVRRDDPNDTIPHELRRDQRGIRALAAWLGHTDLKEDNTLDVWQADPANPRVHYVVHYQLDFGKALGGMSRVNRRWTSEYQYRVDPEEWTASLVSLGLHRQPWEGRPDPQIYGVGLYTAEQYDPDDWKPDGISQFPVIFADRFDQFWGAKILIRFTPAQIAAAVETGRYSDPRASRYLVNTIMKRQRATARHWFREVNPIDHVVVDPGRLCFTDLALRYKLEQPGTRFTATMHDSRGRRIARGQTLADVNGKACIGLALAQGADRYTIVRLESSRGLPATLIHVAVDPKTRRPRVIGIHRM
jgi:hypothetical protein